MENKIKELIELKNNNETDNFIVIYYDYSDKDEYFSENKEIDLLMEMIDNIKSEKDFFFESFVYSKIVDRGLAFILAKGGIEFLKTEEISQLALEVLMKNNINVEYDKVVEYIKNNDNSAMYLPEQWVLHVHEKEFEHAIWLLEEKSKLI